MIRILIRGLVGLVAVLALLLGARFWLAPAAIGETFGLHTVGPLGLATLRADIGALFLGLGVLSAAAAIRDNRRLVTAPLVIIAIALTGRLITAATAGLPHEGLPPMVVEVVMLAILAAGRRWLGDPLL